MSLHAFYSVLIRVLDRKEHYGSRWFLPDLECRGNGDGNRILASPTRDKRADFFRATKWLAGKSLSVTSTPLLPPDYTLYQNTAPRITFVGGTFKWDGFTKGRE